MPWRCPSCRIEIQRSTNHLPDPCDDYRCHVCRLNLRFDPALRKMVALLDGDDQVAKKRMRPTALAAGRK